MFLSAKMFFDDKSLVNKRLLIRMETEIPQDFIALYKRNVVKITPKKTGALRRSLITMASGGQGDISWRSAYALAQNQGSHTVSEKRVVNIDGRFVTLQPGVYRYRNYTTPGTGPHFATIAFKQTQADMNAKLREKGFTK